MMPIKSIYFLKLAHMLIKPLLNHITVALTYDSIQNVFVFYENVKSYSQCFCEMLYFLSHRTKSAWI